MSSEEETVNDTLKDVGKTPLSKEKKDVLSPTPGNNLQNVSMSQDTDCSELDEIPWFSPTYIEPKHALTPGKKLFERYSPSIQDINYNSDDCVETSQNSDPVNLDEILRSTFDIITCSFRYIVRQIRNPSYQKRLVYYRCR